MTTEVKTRTAILKDRITPISKGYVVIKEPGAPAKMRFRPAVKMCLERGKLITQSYKETEGEAEVIKRAKALAKIIENMTLYIQEGELIVGCYASSPSHLPIYPEINERLYEDEIERMRSMVNFKT